MRSRAIFIAPVLLAAALRLPGLAARPMHADEAVHADKFGTLLDGGGYAYDPSEYHGPTLYYLTLPSAWLRGQHRFVAIDEVTLRLVPALLGLSLVAAHLAARAALGTGPAFVAALLAALSPAFVFYSRYYIHETPLLLFTFCALLGLSRLARSPSPAAALAAGVSVGLMCATKETAPLALGAMAVALLATGGREEGDGPRLPPRLVLLAFAAALATAVVLFSSFFTHAGGVGDAVRAYVIYGTRATAASGHLKPWPYYLGLLAHSPSSGTPFWTEGLILVLALVGGLAAWSRNGVAGADARALRFLAVYTLVMFAVYSAIPYKTPWCVLGLLHGAILLAGAGAAHLWHRTRTVAGRAVLVVALVLGASHLGWQAGQGSFRFAADPRNPYVYAHTTTDVFVLRARLTDLAHAHARGLAMPLQIVTRENLWPLPWYLRGFPNATWATAVGREGPNAPVILATPEMESALVEKLYDLPPPGERELYMNAFDRMLELRPGVEVRGYVARSLWEEFRQREAEARRDGEPR